MLGCKGRLQLGIGWGDRGGRFSHFGGNELEIKRGRKVSGADFAVMPELTCPILKSAELYHFSFD